MQTSFLIFEANKVYGLGFINHPRIFNNYVVKAREFSKISISFVFMAITKWSASFKSQCP